VVSCLEMREGWAAVGTDVCLHVMYILLIGEVAVLHLPPLLGVMSCCAVSAVLTAADSEPRPVG